MLFNLFTFTLTVFNAIVAIIQVYRIISGSDEALVELFALYRMHTAGMGYFGSAMFVGVVFILFPQTFLYGTLMLALSAGWMFFLRLTAKDYSKTFRISCYLLLIPIMGYCQYPGWLNQIWMNNCATVHTRVKPVAVCGGSERL